MANKEETIKETEYLEPVDQEPVEILDVSDKYLEKMARGFILGSKSNVRRREIQEQLEEKVTKKIGKKGKYLVDKLFELIEGVYMIDKKSDGRNIRYYQVPPNLNAIIYALDRVLGKPQVHINKSEEQKGVILVEHVIKNLASNGYGQNGVSKNIPGPGGSGLGRPAGIGPGSGGGGDRERVDVRPGEVAVQG